MLCDFLIIALCILKVSAQKRIINGTDVDNGDFKFMVSVRTYGKHSCGGTILNRDHVLTAAHCVCQDNLRQDKITVRKSLDSQLENSIFIDFPIKHITCHEYDILEYINDIAILLLLFPIPNPFYEKIKLAPKVFSTKRELEGVILGWGRNFTHGPIQNTLQRVDVIVYNDTTCEASWSGIRNIEYHICAGWRDNGRGSCQGDSGGPLISGGFQIGIVSFGTPGDCAISDEGRPKIFTRISRYGDWIKLNSNSSVNFDDSEEIIDDGDTTTTAENTDSSVTVFKSTTETATTNITTSAAPVSFSSTPILSTTIHTDISSTKVPTTISPSTSYDDNEALTSIKPLSSFAENLKCKILKVIIVGLISNIGIISIIL